MTGVEPSIGIPKGRGIETCKTFIQRLGISEETYAKRPFIRVCINHFAIEDRVQRVDGTWILKPGTLPIDLDAPSTSQATATRSDPPANLQKNAGSEQNNSKFSFCSK